MAPSRDVTDSFKYIERGAQRERHEKIETTKFAKTTKQEEPESTTAHELAENDRAGEAAAVASISRRYETRFSGW